MKSIMEGGEDSGGGAELTGVDKVCTHPAYETDAVLQNNAFLIIYVIHVDVIFPSDGHYKPSVGNHNVRCREHT
jgi:hypothetical protein